MENEKKLTKKELDKLRFVHKNQPVDVPVEQRLIDLGLVSNIAGFSATTLKGDAYLRLNKQSKSTAV